MKYVRPFAELGIQDIPSVGGKNASLGEMYRELKQDGIIIPNGYATTADAYWHYIKYNDLQEKIQEILDNTDTHDTQQLARTGKSIRGWIMHAELPADLAEEIAQAYAGLEQEYGQHADVAVRSSATAEDLPDASFAGQQETYLNISGIENLLQTCKRVYASLFTDRAISYRVDKGFSHHDVALSIGIQKMVRADKGSSGVMFTLDTESGNRDVVFINGAYGLGENVVQGAVNPDEFYVHKEMLQQGHRPVLRRHLGEKAIRMIYSKDDAVGISTRNIDVPHAQREQFCISDDEVLKLADYAIKIEQHYTEKHGKPTPMDIEWAKDGISGELFILQARPETVQSNANPLQIQQYTLSSRGEVIALGKSVGKKIAAGKAHVILDASNMHELQPGEILVTDITDPDWEPIMKIAAGIVTNRGGRTCHAAIIARELGIPAIVGCDQATRKLKTGEDVTISCAEGDTGFVYAGIQEFKIDSINVEATTQLNTKVMLNLANPERAFEYAALPSDGVGLARMEFIINNHIQIHPLALIEHDKQSAGIQASIQRNSAGYDNPQTFYIEKLAEGISCIAGAFYPRPVILRLSDFKSNEYAKLIGGAAYEPDEENPMLGFRGASRYPSEQFQQAFKMECQAIHIVRERMGFKNLSIMVPFVRTTKEAATIIELLGNEGLCRGEQGLKIYQMCEIPANAILANEFLEFFDGFSIGSNDLTQLTLGIDRDSSLLDNFDERDPAVLSLIENAITACKQQQKYVGICGQAPSDHPDMTDWLVKKNIDSISLNPDSLLSMRQIVQKAEDARGS